MEGLIGNSSGSKEWCQVDVNCDYASSLFNSSLSISSGLMDYNGSNQTNDSCVLPFCVFILSYTINGTHVRVYDMVLMILSALFLFYLLIQLVSTIRKLHGSVLLFRILYSMVFVIPIFSCAYGIVSMILAYYSTTAKILHVMLRGSILMTELSVVVFGLFFKFYGNKQCKLALTLCIILAVAAVFTIVEGVMEFFNPLELPCDGFQFFTHGGMVFLFSTSIIFTFGEGKLMFHWPYHSGSDPFNYEESKYSEPILDLSGVLILDLSGVLACMLNKILIQKAYLATYIVYLSGLHTRWNLPSKKSFYRYALFLSLVNLIQSIGSLMWLFGKHHPGAGNAGICLTLITNVIYITTFPPVVYWIFLSNYFRMNKDLKEASSSATNQINVSTKDRPNDSFFKSWSFSTPLKIGSKRNYLPAHSSILAESYGSSSSYGSLNDEETFTKRLTPND